MADKDEGSPAPKDWLRHAREWLKKQGYPFEMLVADTLRKRGFWVRQGEYYMDPQTGKGREIDVVANVSIVRHYPTFHLYLTLIIDCKRTMGKPWILMTGKESGPMPREHGNTPASKHGASILTNISLIKSLKPGGVMFGPPRTGYSCISTGRDKNQQDPAYTAPLTVVGAAKAQDAKVDLFKDGFGDTPRATLYLPVIVVQGELAECSLTDDGDLELRAIPWGRLRLTNPEVGPTPYAVDIVTYASLPEYAARAFRDIEALTADVTRDERILRDPYLAISQTLSRVIPTKTDDPPA
jgi:hypothetical protein